MKIAQNPSPFRHLLRALALLLLVPVCFGQAVPLPPESVKDGPPAVIPKGVVGDDYVIGPGDSLNIFVWRNAELSVTVPVRPDGKISTPLVEDMVAVGKSPSMLARDIEQRLTEYVRSPQVNVIVAQAASTFSQVKVVGQVRMPQALAYREGLRVLDIVLATGGTTEFASANRARIVRQVNGKSENIRVRLGDLLNKGDVRQNVELKPGDVFIVPQSMF